MEGPAHRQRDGALAGELVGYGGHGFRAAGEHHLGAAVVVGNHDAFGGCHKLVQLTPIEAHHSGHGPTARGGHQGAALLHQGQTRGEIEHPGHMERYQFTEAMTGHQRGAAALGL